MSLRDKAREVLDEGKSERGNFTPEGTPLKLYNYWLENSPSLKAAKIKGGFRKENFCHYWRVVAFWAPLHWLADNVLFKKTTAVIFAVLTVLFLLTASLKWSTFGIVMGITLVATWLLVGLVAGCIDAVDRHSVNYEPEYPEVHVGLARAVYPGYLVGRFGLYYVGRGLKYLASADWFSKIMLSIGALGALVLLVIAEIAIGWYFLPVIVLMLAASGGALVGLGALGEWIQGRRKQKRYAREKAFFSEHPDATDLDYEVTKRSIVKRFFTGLADFLILATQIVRVKKWKICPIVEIETKA